MPIIVDPGFSPPPPPAVAVSSDGRLTAKADAGHAGALLVADFSERLLRTNVASVRKPARISTNVTVTEGVTWSGQTWTQVDTVVANHGMRITLNDQAARLPADTPITSSWLVANPTGSPLTIQTGWSDLGSGNFTLAPGEIRRISATAQRSEASYAGAYRFSDCTRTSIGQFLFKEVLVEVGSVVGAFFDGSTADTPGAIDNRWVGAVGASVSQQYRPALNPLPCKVRFTRSDGQLVRSGHDAYAPGGIAVAYDHEAPLGGPVSWTATPVYADGTPGAPTSAAAISLAAPPASRVWLKSLLDPDVSVLARVALAEESGRLFRSSLAPVVGAELPGGSWDVPLAWTGNLTFRTDTQAEYDQLVAVLSSGVLLMQSGDCAGLPQQLYVLPQGSMAARRMSGAATGQGWAYRAWAIDLAETARPATLDSALLIPGLSYDDLPGTYASYDQLAAVVPSYLALLGGA